MRAGSRVIEEGADFVRRFRRQDVFELACLLLNFRLRLERQAVGEQPLCQPMASDNVAGTHASARRQ